MKLTLVYRQKDLGVLTRNAAGASEGESRNIFVSNKERMQALEIKSSS